jgi:hypothetical protein
MRQPAQSGEREIHGGESKIWGFLRSKAIISDWLYSEDWRYKGIFTRWNRFKGAFPGFGIAAVAFAGYVVAEQLFFKPEHHGHGDSSDHH